MVILNAESIVEQRFPHILQQPPLFRLPLLAALKMLLHERDHLSYQQRYPHLHGIDFVDQLLDYVDFSYSVRPQETERIPTHGRVVIIANHPIGTLDAAVLLKLVSQVRSDVKAVTNQLLADIKPLQSLLLPVNNMDGKTSRDQIKAVYRHLESEGAVIIFPAGEVSRLSPAGIRDTRWSSGFLRIATAMQAPVLPIHVKGRNSMFFYALSLLAKPLSTLWLIREMHKHTQQSAAINIGEIVTFENYQKVQLPLKARVKLFQKHLYRIGHRKSPIYETSAPIAHPEPRQSLRQEVRSCELLGETQDGKQIYLAPFQPDSCLMREIGRLREVAFRAAGEGSGLRRDIDSYDRSCFQLVLWDDAELEIVGAYRLCDIASTARTNGFYSQSLFKFSADMDDVLENGLELGRSFVQPRYWGRRSLDYLWFGIGAFLRTHPQYRYLIGPVSISDSYPAAAKDLLVYFYNLYFGDSNDSDDSNCPVQARLPYCLTGDKKLELSLHFSGDDYKRDLMHLKSSLKHLGCAIPTLYKQYTEICKSGGVRFLAFNIDPDFNNCVDGLVMVDLTQLKRKARQRYIDTPLAADK